MKSTEERMGSGEGHDPGRGGMLCIEEVIIVRKYWDSVTQQTF